MSRKLSPCAAGSLIFLCILITATSHSYRGIAHDARLYVLQALARLEPTSLGQDVFLRLGSQDNFTVFTSIYAALIQAVGLEPAAAVVAFALQIFAIGAAFVLAKTVMPTFEALIGLGIFVSVPGYYGNQQIFACIEQFTTPRMAAEALILCALAAAIANRRILSVLLTLAAALFHPIMATAGFVALIYRYFVIPRPGLALRVLASCGVLLLAAAVLLPYGQWGRFDPIWLELVADRSPYLFLENWTLDSWGAAAVSMTTLLLGYLALPDTRTRFLCHIALVTVIFGFLLTLIAVDTLHVVFITQLQPWRCQWLGVVVSTLILPFVVSTMWQSGAGSRATALFLTSAWIFGSDQFALLACGASLACQFLSTRVTVDGTRLFLYGAFGMLAIALIWSIATNLTFSYSLSLDQHLTAPLRQLISFCHDGLIPVVLYCCAACFVISPERKRTLPIYGFCVAFGTLVLPAIVAQWTRQEITTSLTAEYAPWRELISPESQIYWPQSPEYSWMLLRRPNYISSVQSAGVVFSRATAIELQRRAETLREFVAPASIMHWDVGEASQLPSAGQLQGMCDSGAFDFLVTSVSLAAKPIAIQPGRSAQDPKAFKLYGCSPQARAAAAAT